MHGCGNDFVVIDQGPSETGPLAKSMCDRHFGVGADGLMIVGAGDAPKIEMINPDGTPGDVCGNGLRCVALFLRGQNRLNREFELLMAGRRMPGLDLGENRFEVDLGPFTVSGVRCLEDVGVSGTYVNLGNPHFVVTVDDLSTVVLGTIGPQIENHVAFPGRTNVHFVQLIGPSKLRMITWERGAGETLACGSGACAAAVVAHERGHASPICVCVPGGDLQISIGQDGHLKMTGPAQTVFTGEWPT